MNNEVTYTAYLQGSLTLNRFGQWVHNGTPFANDRISELFSRSVIWDEADQAYFVKLGAQRAQFSCEDTAYFVLELLDRTSPWQIRLSDGSIEPLQAESLTIGSEDQLYCMVKDGKHRARFARNAHQLMLAHALDEQTFEIAGRPVLVRKSAAKQG